MISYRIRLALAVSAASLVALAGAAATLAEDEHHDAPARVVIRSELLHQAIGGDGAGTTVAQWLQSLTVCADGRECGTLELLESDGSSLATDAEFNVGLASQPAVCSVNGARLTYIDSEGRILVVKHYIENGATFEIMTFGPEPPVDPSPYPQVLVPARVLDTPEATAIGRLTVLAGGTACGEINLGDSTVRNEDGDVVFHTHPYGGRVCGDPARDELRFADPQGRLLAERFTFDFRKPMVLFDLTLDPAPAPPVAGTGVESGQEVRGVMLALLVVACMLLAVPVAAATSSLLQVSRRIRLRRDSDP